MLRGYPAGLLTILGALSLGVSKSLRKDLAAVSRSQQHHLSSFGIGLPSVYTTVNQRRFRQFRSHYRFTSRCKGATKQRSNEAETTGQNQSSKSCDYYVHHKTCGVNANDIPALSNSCFTFVSQVVLPVWCIQVDRWEVSLRRSGISSEQSLFQ